MKIISHRGESKYAKENTLSAFYLANLIKSNGIECDVRKTKDNELVLIHDKTINRTSPSTGKVSDYTYDDLVKINFGTSTDNEKIIKLSELLKFFSDKNMYIYIELKEGGYEDLIYNTISKFNLSNVIIISFKYEILTEMRKKSSELTLGYLVCNVTNKIINACKKINIKQVLCKSVNITKKDVKLCDQNNLELIAWAVNSISELIRLEKLNIYAVICDSAYDAKKVLNNE